MKKSSFGNAKPLPGQSGYNLSESQVLEKETKDMERRLQNLQERMKSQESENTGSMKWKSASTDKGPVRGYSKEVAEKHKQKTAEVLGATANARRQNRKATEGSFKEKDVDYWTINDVSEWLADLKLEEYKDVFAQNQINGNILLDITLEDLDYMGITVLGHRKTCLRAIEDIRRNKQLSKPTTLQPTIGPLRTHSASKLDDDESDSKVASEVKATKTMHWSQLEPLSSNKVSNNANSNVNPADNDFIDEEAEREAFKEAVAEWRKSSSTTTAASDSKSKIQIVREYKTGGDTVDVSKSADYNSNSNSNNKDDGLWHNPWASTTSSGNNTSNNNKENVNTNKSSFKQESKPISNNISGNSSNTLLSGVLDEEQEHKEFVKAVEAWRTGRQTASNSNNNKSDNNTGTQSSNNGVNSNMQSYATSLAQQLEKEQEDFAKNLKKQREDAERRLLEANKELERMRIAKENIKDNDEMKANSKYDEDDDDTNDNGGDYKKTTTGAVIAGDLPTFTFKFTPTNNVKNTNTTSGSSNNKAKIQFNDEVYDDEDDQLDVASSAGNSPRRGRFDNDDEDDNEKSTVNIQVIETILHESGNYDEKNDDQNYVVEYESD